MKNFVVIEKWIGEKKLKILNTNWFLRCLMREREGKINESRNVHWMGEGTVNELVLILLILYFMPQMFRTFYFYEKKI